VAEAVLLLIFKAVNNLLAAVVIQAAVVAVAEAAVQAVAQAVQLHQVMLEVLRQ
jgi:hypothetical protein